MDEIWSLKKALIVIHLTPYHLVYAAERKSLSELKTTPKIIPFVIMRKKIISEKKETMRK